jgi:hypothetical protein
VVNFAAPAHVSNWHLSANRSALDKVRCPGLSGRASLPFVKGADDPLLARGGALTCMYQRVDLARATFHNSSECREQLRAAEALNQTKYCLSQTKFGMPVRVRPGAGSAPATFTYSESDTGTACPSQTLERQVELWATHAALFLSRAQWKRGSRRSWYGV